jgi:hypothetical protein
MVTINPEQNWVVVIPMRTSVYFNEDHELRVYVNGWQFNIRYTLQEGDCAGATHPPESPASGSGSLSDCTVVLNSTTNAWDSPNGNVVWNLDAASYPAKKNPGRSWCTLVPCLIRRWSVVGTCQSSQWLRRTM